jgi:hypothetical protein
LVYFAPNNFFAKNKPMGAWVTLHVFDPEKFQKELVPLLKGQKGSLEANYQRYLLTCLRHESKLEIGQIIEISRQFDDTMSHFSGYAGKTNSEEFWEFFDWHYEYARFFTVMIFTHCADLYPYFRTGKVGMVGRMSYKKAPSLAENVLWRLYDYKHFSPHGMGITGWLTQEEMEFLLLDLDNIYGDDNFEMRDEFEAFVKKLAAQKLSILQTIDVHHTDLAKILPCTHISNLPWKDQTWEYLCYE